MHTVDFSLRYPTDPAHVPGMLADADFQAAVARATSAESFDISSDGSPDAAFTLTIVRVMAADGLPAAARSLVGDRLTVRQTEKFAAPAGPERRAAITVTVDKAPVMVQGTETLRRQTSGVTEHLLHLAVTSSMPFFGSTIEQAAAPVITRALELQESAARDWLAR
ncbi:DUF2505 domain-containing protein [Spelaeicoccus albus]|uniref:DUF2505 domain-containing protein n=1 Tax=Spelaeicoccus albus TaxID=1280376 RepID=A0A7Z0D357_9MICO|nr:DUF2505 domain-containing protein [Spelaeicoccus albus]NYI67973.1 hypothetical protein [Spelaeicoccus albus]